MIPAQSVEGGVQPVQLSIPSIADTPAKAEVMLTVTIDTEGNVTSADTTVDDHGLTAQVIGAAKSWKFAPPKAKGKSVTTSVQVKVVF
jgi:TonB family protein